MLRQESRVQLRRHSHSLGIRSADSSGKSHGRKGAIPRILVHGASVDLDGEEVGGMTREDTMESLLSNTTLDTTI